MFQRAKSFNQNFSIANIEPDAATILANKHEALSNRVSKLKHEIITLEKEYEILDSDLNEFLMQYYERFSEKLFIDEFLFEKYVSKDFSENDKEKMNIALLERKQKAKDFEIKNIYRGLVKRVHPDLNDNHDAAEIAMINGLYENSDLEGLLYVQTELDNQEVFDNYGKGLVREIELMESQEILLSRKYNKVKIKLQRINGSPEYKLYIRYKIAEMQNIDFFEKLIKEI